MTADSVLEKRVLTLIARYKTLVKSQQAISKKLEERENVIRDLRKQCKDLRSQIDEMGKDRMNSKQYLEERKQIKDKLKAALDRVSELEKGLAGS